MTNDGDRGINSHAVRTAIEQNALLKDVPKSEIARLKKNAKKRLCKNASEKVPAKSEVENWDKASFM